MNAYRAEDIEDAALALKDGRLVVLPTDTVYGIASDPFSPSAVKRLLDVKGRRENMPPPVLVDGVQTALNLTDDEGEVGKAIKNALPQLSAAFWPGPLTIIVPTRMSWGWIRPEKGSAFSKTKKTVALRVPDNRLTLDLLKQTGPLAVTSANLTTLPPATDITQARNYFGDEVAVYLDGGVSPLGQASTIIDCTERPFKLIRAGGIRLEQIEKVLG